MLRNIVYIPQWIAEHLQRNNKNFDTVLNLSELKEFTSINDLAGLVAFNDAIGALLGLDINMNVGQGIVPNWQSCGCEHVGAFISDSIYPNIHPGLARETFERLSGIAEQTDELEDNFVVVDLGRDVSGIILKYGFFESSETTKVQFQLIEAILQILYVYHPHSTIANTAIGLKYLELLAARQ